MSIFKKIRSWTKRSVSKLKNRGKGRVINMTYHDLSRAMGEKDLPEENQVNPVEKIIEHQCFEDVYSSNLSAEQSLLQKEPGQQAKKAVFEEKKAKTPQKMEEINEDRDAQKTLNVNLYKVQKESITTEIKSLENKEDENITEYAKVCESHDLPANEEKVKGASSVLFYLVGFFLGGVEAAAIFSAFSSIFRHNLILTGLMSAGCSFSLILASKFAGNTLANIKTSVKTEVFKIIGVVILTLSALAFAWIVGETRANDPHHPLPTDWAKWTMVTLNVFIFVVMLAFSYQFSAKRKVANAVNPLLSQLLSIRGKIEDLKKALLALKLNELKHEREIEVATQKAKDAVFMRQNQEAVALAYSQGELDALEASIVRRALIIEEQGAQHVWMMRLVNHLSRQKENPNMNDNSFKLNLEKLVWRPPAPTQ